MVDLKRVSGDNQGNNRGQVRPPPRRPYHPFLNQLPPNPREILTCDEIYSIFKSLTSTPQTTQNDVRQEVVEAMLPIDEHDLYVNTINCFGVSYG